MGFCVAARPGFKILQISGFNFNSVSFKVRGVVVFKLIVQLVFSQILMNLSRVD